jgi:hypothetical protein
MFVTILGPDGGRRHSVASKPAVVTTLKDGAVENTEKVRENQWKR